MIRTLILLSLFVSCTSKNNSKCVLGDCLNGEGTKKWKDGSFIQGYWVDGKLNGHGSQYFGKESEFHGDIYNGEFKDDMYNGFGTYYDKSEDNTYVGHWLNGKPNGTGKLTSGKNAKFPNMYYDGEWKDGLMNGFGTKFWGIAGEHTNNKYVGEWKNDKMDGHGIYYWSDGSYYDGPWQNGEQQGNGTYVFRNGEVFKGYWDKGYCKELAKKMGLE
jgi:hypothetical protein